MYCKFTGRIRSILEYAVLIVAKCIVNRNRSMYFQQLGQVLIVAKCIVNFINSKNSASLTSY